MSFIAEIQGKSPFNAFEDFLTADVFAAFKYIPPHVGLMRFLRTIEGVDAIIPEPDETTVCKYHFWPWAADTYTEPDLLVEIEHNGEFYHVLFEVKYASSLSWKTQLISQYEDLMKGEYLVFKDGWNNQFRKLKSKLENRLKIYLTGTLHKPDADLLAFFEHFKGRRPQLFWTSWFHVYDFFKTMSEENLSFPSNLIVEDILTLLEKKGFSHFQGVTKMEDLGLKNITDVSNVFRVMDHLYREIGLLVLEIEKSMTEIGYKPLPTAGNYVGWVSSDFQRSESWRMKNISRIYVSAGAEEPVDQSILTLIRLEAESDFDFPTVLCGILYHDPLTFKEMNDWKFYSNDRFKTLSNANGEWKDIEKIGKWYSAKPGYRTKIKEIRGYLLNVFDLDSDEKVK